MIYAAGMPFDGTTVYEKSLGGSESAAFYLARELARRGHRVSCWTTSQADSESEGVKFYGIGQASQQTPLGDRFEFYALNTPHDVLIIQRIPHAFHKRWAAKVAIWQLHDLALYRSAATMMGGLWQIDAVTCVSDWHAAQVKSVYGISDEVLRVVPNGVDPSLYGVKNTGFVKYAGDQPDMAGSVFEAVAAVAAPQPIKLPRGKFVLLYQSRPERGLEHLVRPGGIMDRVRDLPVHLIVCGYDNTMQSMAGFYQQLAAWGSQLPNVSHVGALTKPQLAELQRKADLLIYPTEFEEVSCITAMEAMHAALPMLTSEQAALPETCKDSGAVLIPLKDGKVDEDAFVAKLTEWFQLSASYPKALQDLREKQQAAAATCTWVHAADRLVAVIDEAFARRAANPVSIAKSALERSDIDFARWVLREKCSNGHGDAIAVGLRDEIGRLYAFTESPAEYAAHYAKHQGVYYDEHEAAVIGEDVTRTTRFRGVESYLADYVDRTVNAAPAVLDYGCAHGHYLIPLAKKVPRGQFTGVDVSERAVLAARKWATRDGLSNAIFQLGAEPWLETTEARFDVVVAGEVLEHVPEPLKLLELFRKVLKPDGVIIVTTPVGRWEHSGTEAFRTGREHLWHFERADIEEICRGHGLDLSFAPASHDRSGLELGSWIWALRPRGELPFWKPDYARKFSTYAPRQTISACLIVKDGAKTLHKCVESFVDWVDEVILMLDPSTRDRTRDVARDLAADFPNRAFTIAALPAPVLEMGFDEARNASIEHAAGDWILWCDADEEVDRPWNLHKLARPCMHQGYGFAQVHYSMHPPQVLTTDYPCRFFRNRRSIKFYGVVHEHPESEMGKAVLHSIVRPEVQFLHAGYVDEEVRRHRYQRNLPLLVRDREKYPTRELNKFLWLRDLAQGMMFEQEQLGGGVAPHHIERAREGIALMEELVESAPSVRMLSDAMQYYSHCVATSGSGFESEISVKAASPAAPDLAVNYCIKGAFHSRAFYEKLAHRFLEESTRRYEDRYL